MDASETGRLSDSRLPDAKEAAVERILGADASDAAAADAKLDGRDSAEVKIATPDGRDATSRGDDGGEVGGPAIDAVGGRDSVDGRDTKPISPVDLGNDATGDAGNGLTGDASSDAPILSPYDTAKDTTKLDTAKLDTAKLDTAKLDTATPDVPAAVIIGGSHGCASPVEIPRNSAAHADFTLSMAQASHWQDLPCGEGGPQMVLSFTVNQRELVYFDTFGAPWNTILALSTTCPIEPDTGHPVAGTVTCNDDACDTLQSQVVGVLSGGTYYLTVGGVDGETGDITLHFQHAQVGSGPLSVLPIGTGAVSGTTVDEPGSVDLCEGPGSDASYWWLTCPDFAGGEFSASTCNGTAFDSVLALQIPRTELIACNDDSASCAPRSSLSATIPPGAGLNVMSVDGNTMSSFGAYRVTYTRP